MHPKTWAIALFAASSSAIPHLSPRQVNVPGDIQVLIDSTPKYDITTRYDEITEWLAIGDSYSAGISADVKSDQLNSRCSRFSRSYPNQMQMSTKLPGNPTTRQFTFGSCSGDLMDDVVSDQIELGQPDPKANFPKIGNPQIVTLSVSGNDLGFGDIVNNCIYHWIGQEDCQKYMKAAKDALEDPEFKLYLHIEKTMYKILSRVRATEHKQQVQMFVTGYIRFWNETNPQCNDVTWSSGRWGGSKQFLTTGIRSEMNDMVLKLNSIIKRVTEEVSRNVGGVWFVDEFETAFDGHRFCEPEQDPNYHKAPIDDRTWFIHYSSPFPDNFGALSPLPSSESPEFFQHIDAALIPPKNGLSTEDQIKAVNGNYTKLNPAYENYNSMAKALIQLGDNPELRPWPIYPIGWIRIMHPKGFGYEKVADAVIAKFISVQAATTSTPPPPPPPPPPPAEPTKEIFVYYDNYIDEITNDWHYTFFEGNLQNQINLCDTKPVLQVGAPGGDAKNPPKPNGSWKMKLFGQDDCEYANDSTGAGTIKCPDMSEAKPCLGGQDNRELKCIGVWADYYYEVARCLW